MPLANVHYSMLTAKNGISRVANVVSIGSWSNSALGITANSVQLRTTNAGDPSVAILYQPGGRGVPYTTWVANGETYGYMSGGRVSESISSSSSTITEAVVYSSDTVVLTANGLTTARNDSGGSAGTSSSTHGYVSGGGDTWDSRNFDVIDKFQFASTSSATDVGELSSAKSDTTGVYSETNGYVTGGATYSPSAITDDIDKFPFASDTPATNVASLLTTNRLSGSVGSSTSSYGYISGGNGGDGIEKLSFSSDSDSTDVGELLSPSSYHSSYSTESHGYIAGGNIPGAVDTVQRFSFYGDNPSTDVGELSAAVTFHCGTSYTTHGYLSGGYSINLPSTPSITVIDTVSKFSFSASVSASDVGEMFTQRHTQAGNNY